MGSVNWADLVKDNANNPNAGGGDFSPLPPGDYNLKVVQSEVGQTSTGKAMFKVRAEVQDGPNAKRLLFDNLVVSPESPGAMSIFFRKMKALGLDENYFAHNPSDDAIASAMLNRPFRGRIKKSTYQGKERNEFESYAPVAAATPATPQAAPAAAPAPSPAPAPAPAPQTAAAPAPAPAAPAAPPENPWNETQAPPAPPAGPAAPPAPPF